MGEKSLGGNSPKAETRQRGSLLERNSPGRNSPGGNFFCERGVGILRGEIAQGELSANDFVVICII